MLDPSGIAGAADVAPQGWLLGAARRPLRARRRDARRRGAARGTEESGIDELRLVGDGPVDLDRHALSTAFGTCGEHLDVRYAVVAPAGAHPCGQRRVDDVAWFPFDALPDGCVDIKALIQRAGRATVLAIS